MNAVIKAGTAAMDRAEWLNERKKGIGGSDAAAIVGLSAYSSPYAVWADKTDRLPPKEDNEAMRIGRDLESYVADRWEEATGKKCRRRNAILASKLYPFAIANIDRFVVGENAGLECKTTSSINLKRFKNGEYPENYYVQCVHYMAVTGADRWYLSVLVFGSGLYNYEIERNEGEIEALMEAERRFWDYVVSDTPPPADGSLATTEALETIYAESETGSETDLFGRETILREWFEVSEAIKQLETRKETIRQQLMADLGETEAGSCGEYKVTWKAQSRSVFDFKKYAADHSENDLSEYMKTTTFKKFDIKRSGK